MCIFMPEKGITNSAYGVNLSITLIFFSSVSASVEVSVLGLPSAILDNHNLARLMIQRQRQALDMYPLYRKLANQHPMSLKLQETTLQERDKSNN